MIKIYIVDDHNIVVDGIKKTFESEKDIAIVGYAHNGVDALKWLINNDFDVVIMDISMPMLSGVHTFKTLLSKKPEAKVIFFSMYPVDQYAVAVIKMGARGYIRKDGDTSEIISAIRAIHAGKRYIPDYVTEALFDADKFVNGTVSQREVDIIKLISSGKSNVEVSETLHISAKTVSSHKSNFMKKLNLKTNSDIFIYALANGLIHSNDANVATDIFTKTQAQSTLDFI